MLAFRSGMRKLLALVDAIQLWIANMMLIIAGVLGLKDNLRQNFGCPSNSFLGRLVQRLMVAKNAEVVSKAVDVSEIEPHHFVLEVGFGPGIGLNKALTIVEGGCGKVYGLDISPDMVENANLKFSHAVSAGKLELTCADVACLPYKNNYMDRIYHSNCYYFWEDPSKAARELLRVLKTNGVMVTALNLKSVRLAAKRGFLTGLTEPDEYIRILMAVGFTNVSFNHVGGEVHAVVAYAGEKKQ